MALVAGAASAVSAQTQFWNGSELTAVRASVDGSSYGQRITPVWSNGYFGAPNLGFFGALYDYLDDCSFVGTPWQGATGRIITRMQFGVGQFAAGQNCTIRFEFYNKSAVDTAGGGFNAADMLGTVTPFGTYSFDFIGSGSGIYTYFTNGVNITVPDGIDEIYVRMSILNQGTTTIWTGVGNAFLPGSANHLTVGQATTSVGWNAADINIAPQFVGGAPRNTGVAGTSEHRIIVTSAAAGGPGLYMVLEGDLVLPDPPGTIDLSGTCIPDAGLTVNPTLAANGVQFYKVCLADDAADAFEQFFDIDSVGSAGDTSVAMWTVPDGQLLDFDLNSAGNGGSGQLSYGIGRRNGVGDSLQFDGRHGQVNAGTYLVAVATGDAAFGPAYSVTAPGAGGPATLNFRTNTNGTPAAPSVPPAVENTPFDLGDISQLATAPPAADMDPGWVVWYKFEVCSDVADDGSSSEGPYLDFDFSTSFAGSDPMVLVFDSTGAVIAGDDDSGPGVFPQLSFGDQDPARPPFGDGDPFTGQDGNLAAGQYYMAVGLFNVTASTNPRWHARSTSGSSLPSNMVPYFAGIEACGGCGCPADYNGDGGVDGGDVEAFFTQWEASEGCSDTNQDGGVDGGDVEAFFTAWEAGDPTCGG
ncbi:MAG: hypothetical protein JNK25_05130 [Phycisphaerae bacterium]|nr:hypothetical protein [Phycisphaerae bacterium]